MVLGAERTTSVKMWMQGQGHRCLAALVPKVCYSYALAVCATGDGRVCGVLGARVSHWWHE